MHKLHVKVLDNCPNREYVLDYYKNYANKISYDTDCGVDIIFPSSVQFETNDVKFCGLGVSCEFFPNGGSENGGFNLVPRSSITKTPLSFANSIGIFDPTYRGEIIAAFRCHMDKRHPSTIDNFTYDLQINTQEKTRLVQIIAPDLKPIQVILTDSLSVTQRGDKGFGSTNVRY